MSATEKQISYLKDLLQRSQYYNPRFDSLSGAAKHLPIHPTGRERANAEAFFDRLSKSDASELISHLLGEG